MCCVMMLKVNTERVSTFYKLKLKTSKSEKT